MTKRFHPAQRLSAVAIAAALAALAGAASAQSNPVVDSRGTPIRSTYNECVFSGQGAIPSAVCPPAAANVRSTSAPMQVAQSSAAGTSARPAAASAASGASSTPTGLPGYVTSSDGRVVLSGFGQCVRSGTWVPANAAEPCDRMARAELPPPPVAAPAPAPQPAPAPVAEAAPAPVPVAPPEPPRPVIQKLTLSTDVLFDFGKAELKDSGKARLDQLAAEIKDADVDEIVAVGHADRIASEDYNQKLSEQRAQAVKDYLTEQGAKAKTITAEGKGELQPVTGEDCKKLGAERAANKKLVACLQPDRRVEIEVLGSRQVAGGSASPAGAGATGSGSGSSTTR